MIPVSTRPTGDCSNTTDLVHILKRETKRLIGWSDRGFNGINSFKESESFGCTSLGFLLPTLEPGHIRRLLDHVVAMPSGDRDESDTLGIVTYVSDVKTACIPTFLMKLDVSLTISSYRDSDHLVVSILLMATISCLTPRV
jgi:hypothetical protein